MKELDQSLEERRSIQEDYDAKQEKIEKISNVEAIEKKRGDQLLIWTMVYFMILGDFRL